MTTADLEKYILLKSLISGLLSFTVCFFSTTSNLALGPAAFLLLLLPGLIYSITLCCFRGERLSWRQPVFVVAACVLYICVAWIVVNFLVPGGAPVFSLPLASLLGAAVLFILYRGMINTHLLLTRGFVLALLAGFLSALPLVFITTYLYRHFPHLFGNTLFAEVALFSIFPTWQVLFGWAIKKAAPRYDDDSPAAQETATVVTL